VIDYRRFDDVLDFPPSGVIDDSTGGVKKPEAP
jgi:hypothetical protein